MVSRRALDEARTLSLLASEAIWRSQLSVQ
jgi:hypothetical protein